MHTGSSPHRSPMARSSQGFSSHRESASCERADIRPAGGRATSTIHQITIRHTYGATTSILSPFRIFFSLLVPGFPFPACPPFPSAVTILYTVHHRTDPLTLPSLVLLTGDRRLDATRRDGSCIQLATGTSGREMGGETAASLTALPSCTAVVSLRSHPAAPRRRNPHPMAIASHRTGCFSRYRVACVARTLLWTPAAVPPAPLVHSGLPRLGAHPLWSAWTRDKGRGRLRLLDVGCSGQVEG
ncbi:hypothetical protein L226DRAFT_245254 [Lentinus tigrinus ALCF2SS1-7]|uniref:Uncharacterized protein n=1 Tax=Lentinus tigrinus ALCF2SS1-6 TaxID=1328759 RepID=A0A5C2SPR4_9APHY|nr:hypothetical protein L227DRAFT_208431 [Lentinus tigrinus ALCF2SS1-6]RPD79261.1 hypothetical protein L226DRAFT_245254 [Lentinus tigrinus ALCF2SS1-7]